MSEPTAQQQQPQNGKERSKSTEEKEIPREPALVCKDINVSIIYIYIYAYICSTNSKAIAYI